MNENWSSEGLDREDLSVLVGSHAWVGEKGWLLLSVNQFSRTKALRC